MKDQVTIRKYMETDFSKSRDLWIELTRHHQEIYEDSSIGGGDLSQGFNDHLKEFGAESLWVAEVDKEVVGLIGLIIRGKAAEVEPIIISTSYRKRGIGSKMIDFLKNLASEKDLKYLSIRPVARNISAFKLFYEKGFNIVGHIELFMDLKDKDNEKWKKGLEIHEVPLRY